MYINTSHTPDKKNSYLTKFNKKRIQTTDKENKIQNLSNLSNLSTNDDCKSYCDNVDYYRHENQELKKLVFQLKFEMQSVYKFYRKSQLESCLIEQKHNLKSVVQKYQSFIDEMMTQKNQVSAECDDWKQKCEQQQQIIEQQRLQIYNQSYIIQQNLLTIQNIQQEFQQESIQNQMEVQQIMNLKDQTIDELHQIIQHHQQQQQ
ncbi:unnamed protein product (macronuclear) [Paramecium tetraurelia]|uniref:Uncharacterized protein n=1 Tax=Paramecium tetraurelia TaxID=5888 RepID=A0BGT1_PARTE|nr:uncharacterized protein GSPATT00028783001 [Paramecium tetraurelia]CAK57748.1 unnamed protein product [Paramecium tetraurelia]|eukprot:XP_001425146.1 hypothetical protein (macronuclear) [Paramecium tetraurelia strain d4-2]